MDRYYKSLSDEILSKFRRINSFTKQGASIGRYHEQALKKAIEHFLPGRFTIKTGFVYNPRRPEIVSRQLDIIIVDEHQPNSYYFKDDDFVIIHPDAAVCVVEVKTRLSKVELHKCFLSAEILHDISKHGATLPTCNYKVFAYESPSDLDQKLPLWFRNYVMKLPEQHTVTSYPDTICVLDRAYLDSLPETRDMKWGMHLLSKKSVPNSEEWRLGMLLLSIKKSINDRCGDESNPWDLINFDEVRLHLDALRYGEGVLRSK